VSARGRVTLLVAAIAVAAVAIVAAAVLSADGDSAGSQPSTTEPELREGRPPLSFALGFRADDEARALAQGAALHQRGETDEAAALFAGHDSLEAKIGAAFAAWPDGTLDRLEQLAKLYPEVAVVQLHLGLARLWASEGDPMEAWRAVLDAEPDTPYAIVAGNLLHPNLPRGLPAFIPSITAPTSLTKLPPARQLEALRVAAKRGGVREHLLYGVGLQRVGRPVSAARVFDAAAQAFPENVEAQVAGAVGAFDKAAPEKAFGRLGPLSKTYPEEPSVRFHLGVLLLWTGRIDGAERQFRLAAKARPGSPLAREADRYLETIRRARG
jgi:tetratricopeptide (TPR) repeat protein